MSKTLENGPKKIQEISDLLKKEILEPAKQQAETIIAEAQRQAESIIKEGQKQAKLLLEQTHRQIEEERNVFQSALAQSSKQSLESLRQSIEEKLFNTEFQEAINSQTKNPKIIAEIIQGIIKAIDKEGLGANLSAVIPKTVSPQEVNALLGDQILNKLKNNSVELGDIEGGAQIKLNDKKLTLDMSDMALKELLANYVRKDFRKLIFGKGF